MTQNQHITATLESLARLGVREFCVAAGARNAPLVAALAASQGIQIWNFFEERCAAFFALGRIMADRQPVAVVTTSGTAVAELLPATIEAYYQALPLVLVTADRPARFQGSGAPQAIEQEGLFGVYARRIDSMSSADDCPLSGPLHLNFPLDEPLDPAPGISFTERAVASNKYLTHHASRITPDLVLASGIHPNDAVVAAPFLAKQRVPIVAEATANLHAFPELAPLLVHGGESALASLNPSHVLRIGAVPSWRWWRDLEHRPEVRVTNIARAPFAGLARKENVVLLPWGALDGLGGADVSPKLPVATAVPDLARYPASEPAWMQHLASALPAGARVFLGNSLPIREWSLVSTSPLAEGVEFFANRGANGIDGLISTFLGTAAAHSGESWLILGDLSALYDLAAPWIISQLAQQRLRLVIINNGGGKIFSRVASLRGLPDNARQIIENRHSLQFRPFADLWGLDYLLAQSAHDLTDLPDSPIVIEVRPDPIETEAFWKTWQ